MIDDFRPQRRPRPKSVTPEPVAEPADTVPAQPIVPEPAFRPPEVVATEPEPDHDELPVPSILGGTAADTDTNAKHPWYKLQRPFSRRQKIIGSILIVVLCIGAGAGWTLTHHKRAVVAVAPKKHVVKKVPPTPIYSTLSGLPITDSSLNKKTVTAVMVENSIDARPQSGLSDAGVVFEAVAEGGVTRFMALYQDTAPTNVGPIRSARPYYVQWAMGYGAAYAHVGGSPDALADISSWGVQDMNQFAYGSYYHRISARAAPHNVYTGIATLNDLEAKKGYTSSYTGFARKADTPASTPTAGTIDLSLSGPTYDPEYVYDAASDSYRRSEAGEPQLDANTGKQLSPKVVVAMVVPMARGALDSSGAYYSDYTVTGSGTAYIFQDGTVTTGQWSKPSNTAGLTFTNDAGQPIAFNRGQTWISAVTSVTGIKYR